MENVDSTGDDVPGNGGNGRKMVGNYPGSGQRRRKHSSTSLAKFIAHARPLVLALSLGVSACEAPAQPHEVRNTQVFNESFDVVWGHLIQYIATNSIEPKVLDKASGIMYFDMRFNGRPKPDFADCGGLSLADVVVTRGTVNVAVSKVSSDQTKVTVTPNFVLNEIVTGGYGTFPKQCTSTGGWETQILGAL
jgi:hypothetical protein